MTNRTTARQVYVNDFWFPIHVATSPTTQKDVIGVIHALPEADPHAKHDFYQDFEFIDDVPGRVPDQKLAVKARKLEMEFFGEKVISTKLLHDKKGTRGRQIAVQEWLAAN